MRITLSVFLIVVFCLCTTLHAQTNLVFSAIESKSGLSDNQIRNIAQLTDGRLIFITEGVANIYDGTTFKHLHKKDSCSMPLPGYYGLHHSYVEGTRIWIKNYQRLMLIDANTESYIDHPGNVLKSMGISENAADLFIDVNKNYWIKTTSDNLLFHSPTTNKTSVFLSRVSYPKKIKDELFDIAVIKNEVFLFYKSGLMLCYDHKSSKLLYQTNTLPSAEQIVYNRTLMVVQDGDILYTLRNNQKGIMQAFNSKNHAWTTILKTDYWLNTISTDKNNIWVSCKNGLWRIDKNFSKKEFVGTFRLVDGTDVTTEASTLFNDNQGGFWIGTFNHGLLYYHPDRFKFRNIGNLFFNNSGDDITINCFSEPVTGQILIGTNKGIFKYNTFYGNLTPTLIKLNIWNCISMIQKEDRIISQTDKGNFELRNNRVKKTNSPFENIQKSIIESLPEKLQKSNLAYYTDILKDSRGNIWIGTQDGLILYNTGSKSIKTLYTEDGLVNNSIKSLLEDRNGNIWVSTSCGVSHISIDKSHGNQQFQIANFNRFDGVIENEFIEKSIFLSKNELLFIGGVNGMNIIDLKQPWAFSRLQKPLFTSLSLFGTIIKPGELYNGMKILTKSLTTTDCINLNYNQNFISISFSALNYVNPSQTYYQYRLEGVDNDWREIASTNGSGSASYTNLAPGTYELLVKAANNSKEWSSDTTRMTIIIHPPFWKTPFAYFIYFLLIIGLFYTIFTYSRKRTHKLLAQKNAEKLNQMKFTFFTNISHEFRTPLTLILTPLESVLKEIKDTAHEPKMRLIYRHAQNLQNLVNQLLDFRRLEISGEKLNLTFGDMVEFVLQFEDLFGKLAEDKKIRFSIITDQPELYMYFDNDKLHKIINNLLSNSFKFTPPGGSIAVQLSHTFDAQNRGFIQLDVVDSGIGISANDLPNVFNRFYQSPGTIGGSGIGLHLVKEYVTLHSGEIAVESEPNAKTIFIVTIPDNLVPKKTESEAHISLSEVLTGEETITEASIKQRLLVVEDNEDLRGFLVAELSRKYEVFEAADGLAGLEMAQSMTPDLIVSDVMMPKMDGLELCKRIKSDLHTSHIPVILLTARSSEEYKLSGYQSGADEYLSKPFNLDILLLRIEKLIEQQNRRKEKFSQKIEVNPKEITITSIDEQLIQKALICVEKNIDNPDYSVLQFSQDMGMDRTVLYKKLQSITGLAPSDFMRSIRLKRAAQFLIQGQYPVAEVAERVGFNTPKYFTKYFKEAFGVTPSQYAQNGKKPEE
jgi:signal transduction histidine kinase/ligand-binding sensor domain-containing protein/AraC-like DNA-binding protein